MKTLLILAVVLGVLFLYFIVKAEKSLVIKGNEVVPLGINIPKLILDKVKEIKSQVADNKNAETLISDIINDSGPAFVNKIKTDAGNLISKTVDKISELIKSPIENKVNELVCPKKWNFIGITSQNKHCPT
mgnify:CR=1 FL=1